MPPAPAQKHPAAATWAHARHCDAWSADCTLCPDDGQGESPDRISATLTTSRFEVNRPGCEALEKSIGELVAHMLEGRVGSCPQGRKGVFAPIFHCVSVPDVSPGSYLRDYLLAHGLSDKQHMSDAIVQHAIELIGRLIARKASLGFHLCSSNIHRVLLVTVLL